MHATTAGAETIGEVIDERSGECFLICFGEVQHSFLLAGPLGGQTDGLDHHYHSQTARSLS